MGRGGHCGFVVGHFVAMALWGIKWGDIVAGIVYSIANFGGSGHYSCYFRVLVVNRPQLVSS